MSDDLSNVGFWLAHAAASAPVLLMLSIGLVVCYRQRQRRPRVSRFVGWALLAQLAWMMVAAPLTYLAFRLLGISNSFSPGDTDDAYWMFRMLAVSLPHSIISAAIWGTVLWAVLQVDDWRENTASG